MQTRLWKILLYSLEPVMKENLPWSSASQAASLLLTLLFLSFLFSYLLVTAGSLSKPDYIFSMFVYRK